MTSTVSRGNKIPFCEYHSIFRALYHIAIFGIVLALTPGAASLGWGTRSKRLQNNFNVSILIRGGSSNDESASIPQHFVSESVLFEGKWRSLLNRRVQFPSGTKADFEIVSQKGTDQAVLVFAWDSTNKTTTMVREFMPASDGMKLGLAAGVVDEKHSDEGGEDSILMAAQFELEEECRLVGGKWYPLVANILMDKYSTTKLSVYLVIDPIPIESADARSRDELEEGMQVLSNVSIDQLLEWIDGGYTTVVGSWACLLAIRRLREIGEIN